MSSCCTLSQSPVGSVSKTCKGWVLWGVHTSASRRGDEDYEDPHAADLCAFAFRCHCRSDSSFFPHSLLVCDDTFIWITHAHRLSFSAALIFAPSPFFLHPHSFLIPISRLSFEALSDCLRAGRGSTRLASENEIGGKGIRMKGMELNAARDGDAQHSALANHGPV